MTLSAKISASFAVLILAVTVWVNSRKNLPTSMTMLWEADDSPNHDPYFNVFDDGFIEGKKNHRNWDSEELRERLWQTLKDVQGMERHVKEQNALNVQLNKEIDSLDGGIQSERSVIAKLIENGITEVKNKIKVMRSAMDSNVTDVESELKLAKQDDREKQNQQDMRIHKLGLRHEQLATSTSKTLKRVDASIAAAQQQLVATRNQLAKDRDQVKGLIMKSVDEEMSKLSSDLLSKFEAQKASIRHMVHVGVRELYDNVTAYALSSG
eukprot:CAMPEP_0113686022 /NCGR_PEP_ID=MMETSP0038_2-20120614/15037_1 /TAXON_ID=2898 /ORGANISM="Cryptomonas paramecium" /LENGTH=266 /DNA_ID=CAMNT_0000606255 /DNA_START=26 /DNA_END=823 /DNA_ORIENTATION=- /assembly_acc=CAM_ASM_000170